MAQLLKNIYIPNLIIQFRYLTRVRETPWKRTYLRRFGYNDPLLKRPDTLPRISEDNKYAKKGLSHLKEYRPLNEWSDKQKYFGQNDYIDILGDGSIHPVKLLTNMPAWLRGFQGNEFQMLLLKQQAHAHYRWSKPTKWMHMNKRIMFLYSFIMKGLSVEVTEIDKNVVECNKICQKVQECSKMPQKIIDIRRECLFLDVLEPEN